jgi:muconolactone delta-isomerase
MLYLVVSTPHPSKPEDVKGVRAKWWAWAADLKSEGKALCYFARVGRGAVVIFDVTSNDDLHELLTEWLNMVPVTFETYPLVSREQALQFLK